MADKGIVSLVDRFWRFSVADFVRLHEVGILKDEDRVELIDGAVLAVNRSQPVDAAIASRIRRILHDSLGRTVCIGVHQVVYLDSYSMPAPDVSVLCFDPRDYDDRWPTASDILLLIEVAVTSLNIDRDTKIPRYAAAEIPESWLVDAQARTITQFTRPSNGEYMDRTTFAPGETLQCHSVPGLLCPVAEVVGSLARTA